MGGRYVVHPLSQIQLGKLTALPGPVTGFRGGTPVKGMRAGEGKREERIGSEDRGKEKRKEVCLGLKNSGYVSGKKQWLPLN